MNKAGRIVITGGPGAGKSTLIEALKKEGYPCQDEVARELIREFREENINPWNNRKEFIRLVYERIFHDLQQSENQSFFCDRGALDCMAYLKEARLTIPEYLQSFDPHEYYSEEVFILPPREEIYCQDWARQQTFREAVSLYQSIRSTYMDYGFKLIEVPMLPLNERVEFLQQHLKRKGIFEWERI